MIPRDKAEWIASTTDLREMLDHAVASGSFSYDTEFIGERSYFPKLCLIQLGTSERVALVDPLADVDLSGIWELIADPEIETIVHAGSQDLEPVVRLHGKPAARIFDTQVCGGFVSLPYPLSLQKLVMQFLGVKLAKAHTFTRWDLRPLSGRHKRYAADDVRYLPALAHRIRQGLERSGHADFARRECDAMTDTANFIFHPDIQVSRVNRSDSLKPAALGVLRELVIWRDQAARDDDLPPRTMLRDDVLIRLAKGDVDNIADLKRVNGFPVPLARDRGRDLLDAMRRGREEPAAIVRAQLPLEETIDDRVVIDRLWSSVVCYCFGQSIDPALVTSRQELARFYLACRNGGPPQDHRLRNGWRAELLRDLLAGALEQSVSLRIEWTPQGFQSSLERGS